VIVEDNPVDAEITRRAAKSVVACEVEVIPDGETAVARLVRERPPDRHLPDLILLDLHLPAMSGIDVLRQLRGDGAYRATPVIVLTTSDDDEQILECYARGASSFLAKPATHDGFAEALHVLTVGAGAPAARSSH
jgi:CheY-like chemotaxis protein